MQTAIDCRQLGPCGIQVILFSWFHRKVVYAACYGPVGEERAVIVERQDSCQGCIIGSSRILYVHKVVWEALGLIFQEAHSSRGCEGEHMCLILQYSVSAHPKECLPVNSYLSAAELVAAAPDGKHTGGNADACFDARPAVGTE